MSSQLTARDPAEDRLTAYHEAGHAVAAYLRRRAFRWVTIRETAEGGPHVEFTESREALYARLPSCQKRAESRRGSARDIALIRRWLVVPAAGPAAEERLSGMWNTSAAIHDEQEIHRMACYLTPMPEDGEWSLQQWCEWIDRAKSDARALWRNPFYWAAVEVLAERLLVERFIRAKRARAIIRGVITPDRRRSPVPHGAIRGKRSGQGATRITHRHPKLVA